MKKVSRKNTVILLAAGMFVLSGIQFVSRYAALPNLTKGLLIGAGVGLLILALTMGRFKTTIDVISRGKS